MQLTNNQSPPRQEGFVMSVDSMVDRTLPATIPGPREQQMLPARENLFKAVLLVALLFGSFYVTDRLAGGLAATTALTPAVTALLTLAVVGLLGVFNCVLLTGMGILSHEAVHRVLFRSPFWNELGGGLLAGLALTPFYANRQFHLTHHGYAHQRGRDPEEVVQHHPFWFAATIGSLLGLFELGRIFFFNIRHIGDSRHTGRALKDAAFVAFAVTVYFVLVPALHMSVFVTIVPILAIMPVVFAFRGLSEHYGLPPVVRETQQKREEFLDGEAWYTGHERREASGWVVLTTPWLEWLWSHTNYHEVHHKYPYLAHSYLRQVFGATREHYPYEVVPGYWRSLVNLRKCEYYGASRGTPESGPKPAAYSAPGQN
jgi:fatty acid desaturase